jgi:hypothetical protein
MFRSTSNTERTELKALTARKIVETKILVTCTTLENEETTQKLSKDSHCVRKSTHSAVQVTFVRYILLTDVD